MIVCNVVQINLFTHFKPNIPFLYPWKCQNVINTRNVMNVIFYTFLQHSHLFRVSSIFLYPLKTSENPRTYTQKHQKSVVRNWISVFMIFKPLWNDLETIRDLHNSFPVLQNEFCKNQEITPGQQSLTINNSYRIPWKCLTTINITAGFSAFQS